MEHCGVIRDKIPHDKDICMLKKDYDKFNKIAQNHLPEDLWLQNKDDPHYKISDGLIKIRDLNSCYLNFPHSALHGHNGLQIDIFCVSNNNNKLVVDKEPKNICSFTDVFPLKEAYFEDLKVYIPNNSHDILRQRFGKKYMSYPDISKRYPHEGPMEPFKYCSNHKKLYPNLYS